MQVSKAAHETSNVKRLMPAKLSAQLIACRRSSVPERFAKLFSYQTFLLNVLANT